MTQARKVKAAATLVTMQDGRKVEFVGERGKVVKSVLIDGVPIEQLDPASIAAAHVGDISIRMDFRSGHTRTYPLNPDLVVQLAAQGGLYKYGSVLANESADTLEKWPERTDELHTRLMSGEWAQQRSQGGGGGAARSGVLVQAISETFGIDAAAAHEFLAGKTRTEKAQMLHSDELADAVARIRASKTANKPDTSKLFAQLASLKAA